ncbi:hypothetical protein BRADO7014 [Bradyrhizobium sp. ORS 278]|nr:hypothetical protein BRADO7014 [Bradyrhizobium sp. ORS 278]
MLPELVSAAHPTASATRIILPAFMSASVTAPLDNLIRIIDGIICSQFTLLRRRPHPAGLLRECPAIRFREAAARTRDGRQTVVVASAIAPIMVAIESRLTLLRATKPRLPPAD